MTDLPAPLVPADVDLRGLPYMPLDVVRLMDSDLFALSTGDEFKSAVALWCKAWTQVPAGSVPNDDRVLAHLSGAGARWKKARTMAMRGWMLCSDGRWYHPVIAEKAADAWSKRIAQRDRAALRWHKPRDSHGDAVAYAAEHATAMQEKRKGRGREYDRANARSARAPATPPGSAAPDPGEPVNGHDFAGHDPPSPTLAGEVCRAMRAVGLASVNPGDPRLLALIGQGATVEEFTDAARVATEGGRGFAYALGVLRGKRAEGAALVAGLRGTTAPQGRDAVIEEARRMVFGGGGDAGA